jgi:hypothetical protein
MPSRDICAIIVLKVADFNVSRIQFNGFGLSSVIVYDPNMKLPTDSLLKMSASSIHVDKLVKFTLDVLKWTSNVSFNVSPSNVAPFFMGRTTRSISMLTLNPSTDSMEDDKVF